MLTAWQTQLADIVPAELRGKVAETVGTTIAVNGLPAPLGALVAIQRASEVELMAEVVGFRDRQTLVFPAADPRGIRPGNRVRLVTSKRAMPVGPGLLGRVVDAAGNCVDGRPQPVLSERVAIDQAAPIPTQRPRIAKPLPLGIRTIDGLLTCGAGQRLGIFAGSGVGKSVLLGMIAKQSAADVNVIAMIGERGREVNEFLERDLGPEGLARSVLVIATSDEPAIRRVQAAQAATSLAEYFRDRGQRVLLMMDSLTRFAMAQREIGLAAGEPPATRGYPPSVFALLPRLVERAGTSPKGSITALYSVLVEGDDQQDPIADTVRGLLDGHIWLSRKLASEGHFPAIDVLDSISRVADDILPDDHRQAAQTFRQLLAAYREHEDLISIGAYRQGTNLRVDVAIEAMPFLKRWLKQQREETSTFEQARQTLLDMAAPLNQRLAAGDPTTAAPRG